MRMGCACGASMPDNCGFAIDDQRIGSESEEGTMAKSEVEVSRAYLACGYVRSEITE